MPDAQSVAISAALSRPTEESQYNVAPSRVNPTGRVVGSFALPRTGEPSDLAQRERDYSDVRDELWNLLLKHGNTATFQISG